MIKITATVREACEMTGLGKTKLYELMGKGQLDVVKVGRRTLVKTASIRALVEAA